MTGNKFLLLIGIIILVAFSLIIFIYFYSNLTTNPNTGGISIEKNRTSDTLKKNSNEPVLNLTSEKPNLLTLVWQDLPPATSYIEILRSSPRANGWQKWQTIYINKSINGSAEIKNDLWGQSSNFYNYQLQAVSEANIVLVENKTTIANNSGSKIVVIGVNNLPNNNPPANINNNNSNNSGANNNTNTSNNESDHFEVKYVNKKIEIKWWNLPSNVNKAIVYRSKDLKNWLVLLEQQNPELIGPYSISLVDHTFQDSYYYKLSVEVGSEVVAVYGPAFLGPFGL